MLVFWKAKLVLLAVPKTGSTALERAFLPWADMSFLNPPRLKHMTLRRFRRQMSDILDTENTDFETVAVMREPVDWLSSWHRYRSRSALSGAPQSTRDLSFAAFVEAWLEDDPPEYAQVGRQSRFLSDVDGGGGVDHLFRYDCLEEAVALLSDRLNASPTLEQLNVSPVLSDTALPDSTSRLLRERAPEEFDLWDSLCGKRQR